MVYKRLLLAALFFIQYVFARSILSTDLFNPTSYTREVAKNVFVNDCSEGKFPLHIHSIKITPDVVVAGEELTIEATGTLDKPIVDGATANVLVKLGAVRLLQKKFDLCDELDKNKEDVEIQCPIKKGPQTVTQKVTLPKEVPKARFTVDVHAFFDKEQKEPLACLQIIADFRVRRLQRQEAFSSVDGF